MLGLGVGGVDAERGVLREGLLFGLRGGVRDGVGAHGMNLAPEQGEVDQDEDGEQCQDDRAFAALGKKREPRQEAGGCEHEDE